jgi:hypothetical protein
MSVVVAEYGALAFQCFRHGRLLAGPDGEERDRNIGF